MTSGVKLPLGVTKISKRFWSDRIVDRPMSHIKAFASEMLTAIVLLGFFVDLVVKPRDIAALREQLDCLTFYG